MFDGCTPCVRHRRPHSTATGGVLEAVVQVRQQGAGDDHSGLVAAGAKSRQGAHATRRLALREDADGLVIEDATGGARCKNGRSAAACSPMPTRSAPPRASPRGRAGSLQFHSHRRRSIILSVGQPPPLLAFLPYLGCR